MSEKCVHEWYYRIVDIVSWQFFCIRCGEKLSMDKFSDHASDLEKRMAELGKATTRIAELTECIGSQMADVYTLKARIAELEGENKKAFDFVKTLRTYCIYAHWDNPDTEGEFNEFDAEICKWLSEFTERER